MALHDFNFLWLMLALPGIALLRRMRGAWLDQGFFAALSAGYAATFVLISPIAIAGYALNWPIRVLALSLLAMSALAVLDLVWHALEAERAPRPTLAPRSRFGTAVERALGLLVLALVIVDYDGGMRVGSYAIGDAHYHMGKIRTLMDHGFVNWDPFASAKPFDSVYHSSLYHATIAALSRWTGLAGFEGWSRMLPWTKLVVAGSAQALVFALLRSRVLALGAAASAVIAWAPLTIQPYPNQLAALWLLPLIMARGIDLIGGDAPWRSVAGIAGIALVLGQVHGLYYAFACLLLGPALLAALLIALALPELRSWAKVPACGLLALALGLPWLATSVVVRQAQGDAITAAIEAQRPFALETGEPPPQAQPEQADDADEGEADDEPPVVNDERVGNWRYRGFLLFERGQIALDPGELTDLGNLRVQLLLALLLGALTREPRRISALVAMVAAVMLVLHVPALCTLVARIAGAPWMLRRLDIVLLMLGFAVVPYALAPLLQERGWLRGPVPYLLFALALGYAYEYGTDENAWTRERYLARWHHPERLPMQLRKLQRRAALLREYVPPGAELATPPGRGVEIPEICDCFPFALAAQEGTHGIVDMPHRRGALQNLLSPGAELESRMWVITKYGVRHIFLGNTRGSAMLRKRLKPISKVSIRNKVGTLIVLDEKMLQ